MEENKRDSHFGSAGREVAAPRAAGRGFAAGQAAARSLDVAGRRIHRAGSAGALGTMYARRGAKRNRKVSDRMAVVDDDDRAQAQQVRAARSRVAAGLS